MKKHHEDHHGNKSDQAVLDVDQSSCRLTVNDKKYSWSWEWSLDSRGDKQQTRCWERIRGRSSKDVTNPNRIKRLNKLLRRALAEHEATRKAKLKYAESIADSRYGIPVDSESDVAEAESDHSNKSWQRHTRKPPEGQRVEHTKYGVRVWTLDGKTWWDICVNESDTYPGGTAVRLTLPPPRKDGKRWNMGIFDLEMMEAIRREVARGIQPKAVITPKAVHTAKDKKRPYSAARP